MEDELKEDLAEYMATPGMKAALFVSSDGLLVASEALNGINSEALAAQAAGILSVVRDASEELVAGDPQLITANFTEDNLVMTPFPNNLLLVLVGSPQALSISYRLKNI